MKTYFGPLVAVFLSTIIIVPWNADGQSNSRSTEPESSLNIIAAGINSDGREFFDDIGAIRDVGNRYEIKLQSALTPPTTGVFHKFIVPDRQDAIPTITVSSPDDPALRAFVRRIASDQHATVNIDMDLTGAPGGRASWRDQTNKLAVVAQIVAEERVRSKPDSTNTILTHSAATVALSQLVNSGSGRLFSKMIAASPMTYDLPSNVVIMQHANDLPSTPRGSLLDVQVRNSASLNAEGWANRGNVVIKVGGRGLDVQPSMLSSVTSAAASVYRYTTPGLVSGLIAHTESHKLGVRDRNIEVFLPISTRQPGEPPSPTRVEKLEVSNVSPGNVINVLEGRAGPAIPGSGVDSRRTSYDQLKDEIKKLQPPKGGGIALRATATIPIDGKEIQEALWESDYSRIVLIQRGGKRWSLPRMNAAILRTAYRAIFRDKPVDPELSIGAPLGGSNDAAAPGKRPVYYLGPIEDTLMGLILYRADVALGDVAYGGSKDLQKRGLDKVAGFHSLPEMYLAKYTDQPGRDRYLGSDERIVIQTLPATVVASGNDTLAFAPVPELAVRFGRTTPAERGFADLFGSYYFTLMEKLPEFRDLVDCSRAIGIMKWLRENNIRFSSTDFAEESNPAQVFTPHQVVSRKTPRMTDLQLKRPLVTYGEYGPEMIYGNTGNSIKVAYSSTGQIKQVELADRRLFKVHTDDRDVPIALEMRNGEAGAFIYEDEGDVTFLDNVALRYSDGRAVGYERQINSVEIPAVQPWQLINTIARNLIRKASK